MSQKAADSRSTLQIIIFAGIILDSYSVYSGWRQLNDNKAINDVLEKQGLAAQGMDITAMISTLQKAGTLLLLVFLIFDFIAYYYLADYKSWSRKYIMSIALFYLLGCFFHFNILYFIYGGFTFYYLYKNSAEFQTR